jgi:hypothetical protein
MNEAAMEKGAAYRKRDERIRSYSSTLVDEKNEDVIRATSGDAMLAERGTRQG